MTDSDSTQVFDSLPTAIETLHTSYASHPSVNHAFDLTQFFKKACSNTPTKVSYESSQKRRQAVERTLSLSETIFEATPDQLKTDGLQEHLGQVVENDSTNKKIALYTDYVDDVVAISATITEIRRRYPNSLQTSVIDNLNDGITAFQNDDIEFGIKSLLSATSETLDTALLVRRGDQLLDQITAISEPAFAQTRDELKERIEAAIQQQDPERLEAVASQLNQTSSREWTRSDLLACSSQEFEVLVADVWREAGFESRATKFSQDFNIDVIVEQSQSSVNLIQAKQYSPSNPVGVRTVQRTAGLLVEFDANKVFVVTSSSFTDSAKESASRIGSDLTLIDGDRLIKLLNKTSLVPPTPS